MLNRKVLSDFVKHYCAGDSALIACAEAMYMKCEAAVLEAQGKQEPVAWFINVNALCGPDSPRYEQVAKEYEGEDDTFPLYAAPAQGELAKLREQVEHYRARWVNAVEFMVHAPVASGVCCCGEDMAQHSHLMSCWHSPVDQWDHSVSVFYDEVKADADASQPVGSHADIYAAQAVQPDMVLVPREPTEAMEEAVLNCAIYNVEYEEDVYLKNFSECYKFMLIAAAEKETPSC